MGRLPTFLIIGAAKSGTTSLYAYLRQHPEVFMPAVKEPRFFAYVDAPPPMTGPGDAQSNAAAGAVYTLEAYRQVFDGATHEAAVGEASPNYLYSPSAPHRIREQIPDVRLIAILRNPVDRAYSHFLHLVRSGREPLRDFGAALDAEAERIEAGWEWSWHYRQMGFYGAQIARYLDQFDRTQLRVYRFEALKHDAVGLAQDVFRYLGVEPNFVPDVSMRHRTTGFPRWEWLQRFIHNPDHPIRRGARRVVPEALRERVLTTVKNANLEKPPMPDAVRRRLVDTYRDDITRLSRLLDRDFTDWLDMP